MNEQNLKIETMLGSWLVALAGGTFAGTMLWLLGGWSFLQAIFVGGVIVVVLGLIIGWAMSRPLPAPNEAELAPKTITPAKPGANAPATKADPVKVPPAPTAPKVQPSKRLPGQEELSARKGSWKYEKEGAAKPAAAKKAPAKKAEAPASDERPAHLSDAPSGDADDLKKISGVGPKLEETLNSLGIWHYEQVAKLKKKDIAWVDERLRFKGRIERDDWVGQAKELAKAKG